MRFGAILLTAILVWVSAANAGSTRCWIDQGAVVAAASFGDIAGDFIIDVGAPVSRLHVTRAEEDGIKAEAATRPLVLAGNRIAQAQLTIVDMDALPQTDTSIAGIIGADILARHSVTIAFAPCRLTWGEAPRLHVVARLPLFGGADTPMIKASISDAASVRRQWMIVSTGRVEAQVANAVLSRAPLPDSTAPVRLRAIVVGGVLLEQVPAVVAHVEPSSIGTAVWRHWRVMRLNWKRGRLELGHQGP